MSLHPRPIFEVPEETARVAHAAFPKGNIYLRIRDRLGVFYEDEQFASLFSERGQPAFTGKYVIQQKIHISREGYNGNHLRFLTCE